MPNRLPIYAARHLFSTTIASPLLRLLPNHSNAVRRCEGLRMSRKSGYRFSEKDMRKCKNLERILIPLDRDAL